MLRCIMKKNLISLKDVYKTYTLNGKLVCAVKGVNLEIAKGELVSIIGSSGSGKSTLMNILGCLDLPTSGKYLLDGTEVDSLSDNELALIRNEKIGFIFQSFHLISGLTALENVELPLLYRGLSKLERTALSKQALEQVGLYERQNHLPNQLSGGQQQRVAIARAIATRPPIILADEPTGNLDPNASSTIMKILLSLNHEGKTIILITHDPKIAEQSKRTLSVVNGEF